MRNTRSGKLARKRATNGHDAIRQPHLPVFEYIDRERGSRLTYLARHANVTVQAMGEVIDYLERHGYVERVPDPTDGRAKLVRLTRRGYELYGLAATVITELEAGWRSALGDERFRQLKHLLGELWDSIEEREPDAASS